jgi:hypothetical protein
MVISVVAFGASANASGAKKIVVHARPHALIERGSNAAVTAVPVTAFHQEFASNTVYFCDSAPPPAQQNAPCDGNGSAGDYGTIDRVESHFSNGGFGNYAPSTPALTGDWMAVVSGTGDGNQGMGCPGTTPTANPGEACTGPYALFGTGTAAGGENVYPRNGFTVTNDLYLSPTTAAPLGSLIDDDVELNNNAGGYGIDNIITACYESGGFVINFGNGSPGSCSGTPVVTTAGWYRFVFVFSNVAGYAYVTESVLSEAANPETTPPTLVATSSPQAVGGTATRIGKWGGPGYFWLPTEDFSGLPLANFALQFGQHSNGFTP